MPSRVRDIACGNQERRFTVRIALAVVLVLLLRGNGEAGQREDIQRRKENASHFATNRCLAKGGIGVIVGQELHVLLKSTTKNELLLRGAKTWRGQSASTTESVFYFEHRVWARQSLPPTFDLSRAVLVSFEGQRVRFFDFEKMQGCYYDRLSEVSPT
jgi:hypothetical protein